MFILKRDGAEVFRGTYFECVAWVHENCPYSFHHAVEHEGYSMKIIEQYAGMINKMSDAGLLFYPAGTIKESRDIMRGLK